MNNTLKITKMKTRMISVTLSAFFAFTAFAASGNTMNNEICGSSNLLNPVSSKCEGMTRAHLLNDAAQLDEWFGNRDSWEQAAEEFITENTLLESASLEEWVNGMESWEQLAEIASTEFAFSSSVNLEEWVNGMESWEQLAQVTPTESAYSGSVILDQWITGIESWEKE